MLSNESNPQKKKISRANLAKYSLITNSIIFYYNDTIVTMPYGHTLIQLDRRLGFITM
jgi:hypothetical protein